MAKRGPKGIDRNKVLARIYHEVAAGRALSTVLAEDKDMPGSSTFWRWHMEDQDIRDNLAHARTNAVELHLGEIIAIADDRESDPDPASRRVRIYAREKFAQMIAPRKYGPKLDVTSNGERIGLPAEIEAARRRLEEEGE
jgi:hypothetical protein